jgi:hypothetical protein
VTKKVTQTKLVTQWELLLCYTSKKVISKLHKLTNYKSNYTKHKYGQVNKLVSEDANHREDVQG